MGNRRAKFARHIIRWSLVRIQAGPLRTCWKRDDFTRRLIIGFGDCVPNVSRNRILRCRDEIAELVGEVDTVAVPDVVKC
jgi:hypothetical protein